ncbi:MAG: dehydrogenase [Planctomycetaceae bacterium]|jgi:putative membrane-bound dehydrogenase-like protein|nr:dehydrogenase [Planctomycetaceae bacterium]
MHRPFFLLALLILSAPSLLHADDFIPRRQDKPPGPALSPMDAIAKMVVPEGFTVELVAAEPQIFNPVGMAIDEKGRFWVTESFEYPRKEPGPGRDRIKVLEDTTGDGRVDKVTVFAEGLNIPSGIAVGYGGVWVANSPDILFMQDLDGDLKVDKIEKVVTGFGRTDTHELPNSLTWGPDGWLYGLNGVFNYCDVKYTPDNPNFDEKHSGWKFTCALFRIHPRTREFELFAEGTSNPWGVAWNKDGEAFLSACVIDHLWHLTQSGYYHRQGGPYPPHTWKLESIVKHQHQKAAYCGIHYYDSDVYPEEYREKLYMGNIHGNCLNADALERDGSTYFGTPRPDFLTANDVWFMPVVQKTGPDGCIYVLDWYDRYHCYQDANRDPEGVDRGHGRLYRIRYKESPHTPADFNLAAESDDQLIERLSQHNDFIRWTAQRLLSERSSKESRQKLETIATNNSVDQKTRLHAFWSVIGIKPDSENLMIESEFMDRLMSQPDPTIRAWAVRAAGQQFLRSKSANEFNESEELQIAGLVDQAIHDESEDVRVQGVILAGVHAQKTNPHGAFPMYTEFFAEALKLSQKDKLIPNIVWRNLLYYLNDFPEQAVDFATVNDIAAGPGGEIMIPRLVAWMIDHPKFDAANIAKVISYHSHSTGGNSQTAAVCLSMIGERVQNRTLAGEKLKLTKEALGTVVSSIAAGDKNAAPFFSAAMLGASWGDPVALKEAENILANSKSPEAQRLQALNALVAVGEEMHVLIAMDQILADKKSNPAPFRGKMISALGRLRNEHVASLLVLNYYELEPELKPRAIDILTQRKVWSISLLKAIADEEIPTTALNLNQVKRLLATGDKELTKLVAQHWGQIREGRDPKRDQVIGEMKQLIRSSEGDPFAGELVFNKVCGQCHKIYGKGEEVGPEITLNGRNSFEQLLSNVFDPSLVIGASYQSYTVVTDEGRVLNGLLVEDTKSKITLKIQGGKRETIPRAEIEILKKSPVSLMPEKLEEQIKAQELIDLFAFITLDKHPSDKSARQLPGVKEVVPRIATNPQQFAEVIGEVAPGFTTQKSGMGDVSLQTAHMNRSTVVRTHPVNQTEPCVLSGSFEVPSGKKSWLLVDVAHHPEGDWRLEVKGNGKRLLSEDVGGPTSRGWQSYRIDLSQFAGQSVKLELQNHATGWRNEFGYWSGARVVSE